MKLKEIVILEQPMPRKSEEGMRIITEVSEEENRENRLPPRSPSPIHI